VIIGFRDKWLEQFYLQNRGTKKIPASVRDRLFRKLQLIDDASSDVDLRVPTSNHFEKLSGRLEPFCSIRVNRQWRLIFRWNGERGEAESLYLDNHDYR
jgi:toxin HigB-1